MNVQVLKAPLAAQTADAWIVPCWENRPVLPATAHPVYRRLKRMIEAWIQSTGYRGRPNDVSVFPTWEALPARFVVLAGLGARKEYQPIRLSRALSTAFRVAKRYKLRSAAVSLGVSDGAPFSSDQLALACSAGLSTGSYEFSRSSKRAPRGGVALVLTDARSAANSAKKAVERERAADEILTEVRDLANAPANEAIPMVIAKAARAMAARYRVACKVLGRRQLQARKYAALLAVAQGSDHEPCLITLKYRGADPRLKPIVLVGKTITFDAGGISLKPSKGMEWMKYDKCGGMAVLAATLIAARMKLRHPVIGILAVAENMPGGHATRPGDIVRSLSGKTIEILNTDAEGRLALADALTTGARYQPEAMVDLATLTGACVIALGHHLAGLMGNQQRLIDQLQKAGEASGERLWPLPLLSEYAADIRGQFADLKNVGEGSAGTIIGGTFLRQFVPETIPWAHIDIAGTAWEEKDQPYRTAGATAFGARLLVEWIRQREG